VHEYFLIVELWLNHIRIKDGGIKGCKEADILGIESE
jgi:hypothetical protein